MQRTSRLLALLLAGFGLLAGGLLSVSDRFPFVGSRVAQVVDPSRTIRDALPLADTGQAMHLLGWGLVAFAACVAAWRLLLMPLAAGIVFAVSAIVEVLQREYSATRTFSLEDISTNAAGVLLGMAAAVAFVLAVSLVSRAWALMAFAARR